MKKWALELNRQLSKEEVQMANKYMKKFSTFLSIKKMQIKTHHSSRSILLKSYQILGVQ
jgi:hypothetical protein